ncbi:YheT family hydrolase [Rufibacter sediminis]|uniref:Alpha/beta fold hydrolase n=1 Tax=Rufibacter sediminis TaxID=2762756 RepID=A0ABR6VTV5_9BACT|nr:alpha/beta fold hydrolase [Rufibacter sediminis]MBC3540051.1 alpha/beta fold hydrolase [Rufibacter sediminis]
MPLLPSRFHKRPRYLFNGHLQTILPSTLRRLPSVTYSRERIVTPDQDFLDLDWSTIGSASLVVLSHGLEGDTKRPYMQGMVRAMNRVGWDALAWNFRSCSGEPNHLLRSYHMGAVEDLDLVVQHAMKKGYQTIYLVGFSMGGNLTLNYLSQWADKVPRQVARAAVFSVPCHMESACVQLAKPANRIYMKRFLRSLHEKLKEKAQRFDLDLTDYEKITTFEQFDDRYTAPLHGFANAADYYERCSSVSHLHSIQVPTLLVNAQNDPFLSKECFPVEQARQNPYFYLEMPKDGGHVGFSEDFLKGRYYSERRAVEFLQGIL